MITGCFPGVLICLSAFEALTALTRLPARWKLVTLATGLVLGELALRRFAPRSRAYARWKATFEAVGSVWTAVLLSVVYLLSVGPISLAVHLFGRDPLDRALKPEPTFWRSHEPNPLGPEAAVRHQF
jgi:hypothetical protein